MPIRNFTDCAQAGQTFFGLPERTGVTSITVNGDAATFTETPAGVVLDAPVEQDDVVVINFDLIEWGG